MKRIDELSSKWLTEDLGCFGSIDFDDAKLTFIAGYNAALPVWQKLTPENAPSDFGKFWLLRDDKGKRFIELSNTLNTYDFWAGDFRVTHFAEIVWPKDEEEGR